MIKLDQWEDPKLTSEYVGHFQNTYGIDVTKLPEGLEYFLSLAHVHGVAKAYMILLQTIQTDQVEESVTEL